MLETLNKTVQGESHKAINKVCQDYSFSTSTESMSIAIVSDGHGGKRYFRSNIGAKLATEIAALCIKQFTIEIGNILQNEPFSQVYAKVSNQYVSDRHNIIDEKFQHLFASIVSQWNTAIEQDWKNNPMTEDEMLSQTQDIIDDFRKGTNIEKSYGCTLIAACVTKLFWFAFQVGDGKCVAFSATFENLCCEPIPWDERCFLNKTTSLCDNEVGEEFRYCYGGEDTIPFAIFMGSDGIDDSWGAEENLYNYYVELLKSYVETSVSAIDAELGNSLSILSRRGSQDDMSIACILNPKESKKEIISLIHYQIEIKRIQLEAIEGRINERTQKVLAIQKRLEAVNLSHAILDLQNLQNDIDRLIILKTKLVETINNLKSSIGESDDIQEESTEEGLNAADITEEKTYKDIMHEYSALAIPLFGTTMIILQNHSVVWIPQALKSFSTEELKQLLEKWNK